jgi:hypothetical protein
MTTIKHLSPVSTFRHWREVIRYTRHTTAGTGLKIRFDAHWPNLIVTDDESFEIWIEGGAWIYDEDIDGTSTALPAWKVSGLRDYLGGESTARPDVCLSHSVALSVIRAWLDHTRDITVENLSWTLQTLKPSL